MLSVFLIQKKSISNEEKVVNLICVTTDEYIIVLLWYDYCDDFQFLSVIEYKGMT